MTAEFGLRLQKKSKKKKKSLVSGNFNTNYRMRVLI